MQPDSTQPASRQLSFSEPPLQTPIIRRYGGWVLAGLVSAYALGWYLATIGTIGGNTAVTNVGVGLLTLEVIGLLVLDWGGFTTLHGLVDWSRFKGQQRFWLIVAFIALLAIDMGVYLARAVQRFYAVTHVHPRQQLQTLWQRLLASSRTMQAIIASATLVAVLTLTIGTVAALGGTGHEPRGQAPVVVRASSTATLVPTLAPTVATTPTLTPTPVPASGSDAAVLGGTLPAFVDKYGQPNDKSSPAGGQYNFGDNNYMMITVDPADSTGQRVDSILTTSPTKAPMDPTTARDYCQGFAPQDARYQRRVQVTDANGVEGYDDIYISATLTHFFKADEFKDANLNTTQAGTFDIQYLYVTANDDQHIDSCNVQIGAEQTKA